MRFQTDCIECSKNQGRRIFRIAAGPDGQSEEQLEALRIELEQRIESADPSLSPADLSQIAIRLAEEYAGNPEPFREIKRLNNELALSLLDGMRETLRASADPLRTACQLSACGNIIDLGTQDQFDIQATIKRVLRDGFKVDDFERFRKSIESKPGGANLLYLCDNAGEIVFDRLFIEELRRAHPRLEVTAAVNGGPILNDATMVDAAEVGLDKAARVIENGHPDLGTVLDKASDEFLEAYRNADVIVSKGQANYETLSGRDENIFFILKAKCGVIARSLGVELYDAVMAHQTRVKETQLAAFGPETG